MRSGTSKEYNVPIQKFQDQKKFPLEVATTLRQSKLLNLKSEHEAREQAINRNYEVI